MIKIAIDAMGGDHGPKVVVPAALEVLETLISAQKPVKLILVGDEKIIENQIATYLNNKKNIADQITNKTNLLEVRHATEQVLMDESIASALRTKKDSSMRVAINLVKEQVADAAVSAGNTGALMAIARFVLKTMPGVDRPAITYSMPTWRLNPQTNKPDFDQMGKMRMLDLGANVDCTGEHLFQFAVMAQALVAAVDHNTSPKVALLNIGEEAIKGTDAIKQAAKYLENCKKINYIGFVEGHTMYQSEADILVCDGFVGNVALKTSEGVAKIFVEYLQVAFRKNILTKLIALLAYPVLKGMKKRFEPSRYNGASLLGLNGIVIKSHGNANVKSFKQAILEAIDEVENNVPAKIKTDVAEFLVNNDSNHNDDLDVKEVTDVR